MNRRKSLGGGARGFLPLKGKNSFTLAEVLITLGVIGIVAALTLPALIQHHKKQEATARLKKFVSSMEQAIMLSEVDNGSALYWSKTGIIWNEDGSDVVPSDQNAAINQWYNKYLKDYLKTVRIEATIPNDPSQMRVYFADGSTLKLYNGGCVDMRYDVNGERKPNVLGRDIFTFLLCLPPNNATWHVLTNGKVFGAYDERVATSREEAKRLCGGGGSMSYCTNLLQFDNWEFKDDYPYKL